MKTSVLSLALTASLLLVPALAHAQGDAPAKPAAPPAADAPQGKLRPVSDIVRAISRASGVTVLADSSVSYRMATPPTEPTTAENFAQQIADLVKSLAGGTTWAKLYLPEPTGKAYTGDDVSAFATAQAKLFGRIGDTGDVEVLGKVLPTEKAPAYVTDLNLKPVYLVTNPNSDWSKMTDDQKQQYAKQQAQRLLNGGDAARQAFMQSHFAIMGQLMQQMTPEQRQAMMGNGGRVQVFVSPDGSSKRVEVNDIIIGQPIKP